jgi:hypothetical protein
MVSVAAIGQRIARCPNCRVALWSNYAGAGDAVRFVRVGTLDDPDRFPPDIPHLHGDQAAVGGASARRAGRAGVLRHGDGVATRKSRTPCGIARHALRARRAHD